MLTEAEIKAYTVDIPAAIQQLKGEPPVEVQRVVGPPPDCCTEWTRSARMIDSMCVLADSHGMGYRGAIFNYCPWCGRARPNGQDEAQEAK